MSIVNKTLAVLAALAFFLPFVTISCNKTVLAEAKGYKFAQCAVSQCTGRDLFTVNSMFSGTNTRSKNAGNQLGTENMNIETSIGEKVSEEVHANLVLFAAIACLVAIAGLFITGRGGEFLSGLASVASIVLLIIFRSKFPDLLGPQTNSAQMKDMPVQISFQLQFASGFWLSIVASACSAILAFKGTAGAKAPVSSPGPIGGYSPPQPGTSPGSGPQMSACPACGSSNTATNKFCLSCGSSLPASPPPAQPQSTSANADISDKAAPPVRSAPAPQDSGCPSCGAGNPSGNKFCLACGGSLMPNVQLFQRTDANASSESRAPVAAAAAAAAAVAQPLPFTAPTEPPPTPIATSTPQESDAAALPEPLLETRPAANASVDPPEVPDPQPEPDPPASQAEPPSTQQTCSACGSAVNEGQKFCLSCGNPLSQSKAGSSFSASSAAPTAVPNQTNADTQLFQAPARNSTKVLLTVVVLLAAVGAGGWYAFKYFSRPDVTVSTFPQKTHVAPGGRTSLTASVSGSNDTDVVWSIQEGAKGGEIKNLGAQMAGGQVHAAATYNAPQTNGVYHVIATSHANPGRNAKIEIVVGGVAQADTAPVPAPSAAPIAPPSTTATPAASYPNAALIVGAWSGPTSDARTSIGADSTISTTYPASPEKNLSGTYHFTDNTHLDVDFGNGDARKWEILGIQGAYLRVSEQSKNGSSAIIFQKVQ